MVQVSFEQLAKDSLMAADALRSFDQVFGKAEQNLSKGIQQPTRDENSQPQRDQMGEVK